MVDFLSMIWVIYIWMTRRSSHCELDKLKQRLFTAEKKLVFLSKTFSAPEALSLRHSKSHLSHFPCDCQFCFQIWSSLARQKEVNRPLCNFPMLSLPTVFLELGTFSRFGLVIDLNSASEVVRQRRRRRKTLPKQTFPRDRWPRNGMWKSGQQKNRKKV